MTDEQSFTDLDALVLAEIESASGGRPNRPSDARSPKRHEAGNLTRKEKRLALPRDVSRIHGTERDSRDLSGEEAEFLEQPLEMEEPEQEELSPSKLFTPEEEAFMHRAVGFLNGRENGDMILGQIWERLMENHPESFYLPPQDIQDRSTGSDSGEGGGEQDGTYENGESEQ